MDKKELVKRYALFIVSLFFAAMGVAVTKRGELGVSPISSVANVLSCKESAVSLGTWLIIWNCALCPVHRSGGKVFTSVMKEPLEEKIL